MLGLSPGIHLSGFGKWLMGIKEGARVRFDPNPTHLAQMINGGPQRHSMQTGSLIWGLTSRKDRFYAATLVSINNPMDILHGDPILG